MNMKELLLGCSVRHTPTKFSATWQWGFLVGPLQSHHQHLSGPQSISMTS